MDRDRSDDTGAANGAAERLARFVRDTARRYDALVARHAEMYTAGRSSADKTALASAFVARTLDDAAALLNDTRIRDRFVRLVRDTTERVIDRYCHRGDGDDDNDDGSDGQRAIARGEIASLHSYYLYAMYLVPRRWSDRVRELKTYFRRDERRDYERYVAVKTALERVFASLTEAALDACFVRRR